MPKASSGRIAPKKQFSQNFLTNTAVAQRIVDECRINESTSILEIGPGEGALTKLLVNSSAKKIHAVDLDARAVEAIKVLAADHKGRLTVEQQDVLRLSLEDHFRDTAFEQRRVVGNIPYAITSDILFWLFDHLGIVQRAVIMMQKEVALRLIAKPRTKEYGVLSVAAWYSATPRLCFDVSPGSFFPRPKVTSTVVAFDMREEPPTDAPREEFRKFVRAAFSQRRKVLSNALKTWAQSKVPIPLKELSLSGGRDLGKMRAEELSPPELADLYAELVGGGVQ